MSQEQTIIVMAIITVIAAMIGVILSFFKNSDRRERRRYAYTMWLREHFAGMIVVNNHNGVTAVTLKSYFQKALAETPASAPGAMKIVRPPLTFTFAEPRALRESIHTGTTRDWNSLKSSLMRAIQEHAWHNSVEIWPSTVEDIIFHGRDSLYVPYSRYLSEKDQVVEWDRYGHQPYEKTQALFDIFPGKVPFVDPTK